jgi:hypothetical protein
MARLAFALFLVLCLWSLPTGALAAECTVADPTGTPLNLRSEPGGEVIGTLPNGLTVVTTSVEGKWVLVVGFRGDYLGYVFKDYLKCRPFTRDETYPLILSYADIRSLGLDYETSAGAGEACFSIGDGLSSLRILPERVAALNAAGMPLDVFCFVARVDGFRYHPETGKRLPSIVIDEYLPELAFEYPVVVPDCVKRSQVAFSSMTGARLSLGICDVAFNPFTGRAVSAADKALLMGEGVFVDGSAGPQPSEASLAAIRGKRTAAKKQVEQLKNAIAQ